MITTVGLAQVKIGDNLTSVNANSILELESTTKALLLPRLTQTQIDAMQNVPAGMLVYNSSTNVLNIRTASGWLDLVQAAAGTTVSSLWSATGTDIYNTNSGKIGIGTRTPYSKLANTAANTLGSDGAGGSADNSFSWAHSQPGYVAQIYNGGTGGNANGMNIKVNGTSATAFDVSQGSQGGSAAPLLTVKAGGNVGVGKASPNYKLDVAGTVNADTYRGDGSGLSGVAKSDKPVISNGAVFLGGDGTLASAIRLGSASSGEAIVWKTTDGGNKYGLDFFTASQSRLSITSTGQVGIGTSTPSEALEVAGNIKYSGNLQMGVQYVFTDFSIPASTLGLYNAGCPSGTKLIGGGGGQLNPDANTYNFNINYSGPNKDDNNQWLVVGKNLNSTAVVMRIYAICAKVQ